MCVRQDWTGREKEARVATERNDANYNTEERSQEAAIGIC